MVSLLCQWPIAGVSEEFTQNVAVDSYRIPGSEQTLLSPPPIMFTGFWPKNKILLFLNIIVNTAL